uniref:Retrotransposon gag domain-containing protein n=1 Tax=Anabas testudineus TaxID=64144 RepID=A0AAQ6INN1_ANATE
MESAPRFVTELSGHKTDSARDQAWKGQVEGALADIGTRLETLSTAIQGLGENYRTLASREAQAPSAPAPAFSPLSLPREIALSKPPPYNGDPENCRPFLTQCDIYFSFQPSVFISEQAKVGFVISLLTGPARAWATAEWSRASACCSSFKSFSEELTKIFDPTKPDKEAAIKLSEIKQGSRSVAEYSIEFRTLAALSAGYEPGPAAPSPSSAYTGKGS